MTVLERDVRAFARSTRHDARAAWWGRWPDAGLPPVHPAVSIATSEDDLDDIGRLRYELYIARDGKAYRNVDHAHRIFREPVDTVSLNYPARMGDELLAAVRLVRADDALVDPHLRLLVEAYQPTCTESTVVCSRFAVRPEHRARALIKPLFIEVYRIGLLSGAQHCIVGTRDDLTAIFERFGFRRTDTEVNDPVASHIHVLDLDSHDLNHMRSVKSPLLPFAEAMIGTVTEEIT
jgi:predicted GNAT family N-acyltransferase